MAKVKKTEMQILRTMYNGYQKEIDENHFKMKKKKKSI